MRDKTKTWSGMGLAAEWLWLIFALTWEPQLDKKSGGDRLGPTA